MEPDSSWWCAVKEDKRHILQQRSPTRHKGKREKKCVSSEGSQALEMAVQSCRISILGDVQGLAKPASQISPALIRGLD